MSAGWSDSRAPSSKAVRAANADAIEGRTSTSGVELWQAPVRMGWLRFLWLVVPMLGLAELGGYFFFSRRAPRIEAWHQIVQPVAEVREPDMPVVVAPYWAEPLARSALGSAVMPLRDVARPDVTGYTRALEVSILGQDASELSGWSTVKERDVGDFRLRVRQNPTPAKIRFDFVAGLDPKRVSVLDGQGSECGWTVHARTVTGGLHGHIAFPRERFSCPGGPQHFVGATVVDDENYRPHRCIWAHPSDVGALSIRYRAVPLGRVVRGYGALSWFLMRDGVGTPIEMSIVIDGERIGEFVHSDEQGWHAFEFSTGSRAGKTADVTFEIRSESPKDRHFCFYADTR